MMIIISWIMFTLPLIYGAKSIGECNDICHSFIREVLTLEMCREAKKLLPRPKIGDFCIRAMEDGYKDACYAMCQDREPVPRISQACRSAAMELPRPTVRKWCEHGYRQGYKATIDSLSNYFARESAEIPPSEPSQPEHHQQDHQQHDQHQQQDLEETTTPPPHVQESIEEDVHAATPTEPSKPESDLRLLKSIPITLDEKVYDLKLYEGQSPEDSVASFCQEHLPEDISGCIRQLLLHVLDE